MRLNQASLHTAATLILVHLAGCHFLSINPVVRDDQALKSSASSSPYVFIAGIEPGQDIDCTGLALFVDSRQMVRGVSRSDAIYPEDIIAGPHWNDTWVYDIRPQTKGYVVFTASPDKFPDHALLAYAAFAASGSTLWLSNRQLDFTTDGIAPQPPDATNNPLRTREGALFGLAADVTGPGVYYLGDLTVAGRIAEATSSSQGYFLVSTAQVTVAPDLEAAKVYARSLGLDADRMTDLSGQWRMRFIKDLPLLFHRKAGQPIPAPAP